jgi:hypothetical protein
MNAPVTSSNITLTFPHVNMLHNSLGYLRHLSLCDLCCVEVFGHGGGHSGRPVLCCSRGLSRHWGSLQGGTTLWNGWAGIDLVLWRLVGGLLRTGHYDSSTLVGIRSDDGGCHCWSVRNGHWTTRLYMRRFWCLERVDSQRWSLMPSLISWGQKMFHQFYRMSYRLKKS